MIGSHFRHLLDKPLYSLAKTVNVSPNSVTIAGFIVTIIAAYTLTHNLFLGGLLIILGGLLDMFDGLVARANNRASEFGAFFDSVIDRYSDAVLFLGFSWYFFEKGSITGVAVSMGSMIGALLISYTRARAEGLGKDCKTGIMERPERIILMSLAALTGLVLPIMWIMLILTHVTVVQRILYIKKSMEKPSCDGL